MASYSEDNPADVISRGRDPTQIRDEKFWWEGSTWLKENEKSWPKIFEINKKEIMPETRKTINLISTVNNDHSFIERYSSLMRLLRIIAYCLRFGRQKEKIIGPIQANEISKAMQCVVRSVQSQYWEREIDDLVTNNQVSEKSKILRLSPSLDKNQILRVGGRLKNTETLDIFQRQPMLIPQSCSLSKLIFRDAHEKIMHGGPAAMLSYVRERFWPINGRNMARKVFHECVSCFKTKPATVQPIMGTYPNSE